MLAKGPVPDYLIVWPRAARCGARPHLSNAAREFHVSQPDEYDPREEERRRPRRRDEYDYDDDYDYDRPRRRPQRAGLDGMFLDTNMFFLVLFGLCCGVVAIVLSIVELATGKDPEAKQRATTVLVISIVMAVVATALQFAGLLIPQPGRRF